jgi:hypothetical protein
MQTLKLSNNCKRIELFIRLEPRTEVRMTVTPSLFRVYLLDSIWCSSNALGSLPTGWGGFGHCNVVSWKGHTTPVAPNPECHVPCISVKVRLRGSVRHCHHSKRHQRSRPSLSRKKGHFLDIAFSAELFRVFKITVDSMLP